MVVSSVSLRSSGSAYAGRDAVKSASICSLPLRRLAAPLVCRAQKQPAQAQLLATDPAKQPEDPRIVQSDVDADVAHTKNKPHNLKVFVAGATGGVGSRVVQTLHTAGTHVRALARDVNQANLKLVGVNHGVQVVRGDVYEFSTLPGALADCNAIICCTGANNIKDPFGPFNVDYQGTLNLIALAKQKKIKKFILVSSIGAGDSFNPLNLFWGVLFWKKRAEEALQRSGLDYTIVRPGGLKNRQERRGTPPGNIVMGAADTFGLSTRRTSGTSTSRSILRKQVAEVCVAALHEPAASNKVVEIVADRDAPFKTLTELFESVQVWQ